MNHVKNTTFNELIQLYKIPSHTNSDGIKKLVMQYIPDYNWTLDEQGNMYGSHPDSKSRIALSAHLDMVRTGDDIANVVGFNGLLFGIDKDNKYTSIGADDKNGIWCIIQASRHPSKPHIVLFEKEETGRVGSLNCNPEWFSDKDCCIVIDRKGHKEIIIEGSRGQYSSMLGACFKSVNPDWEYEKGLGCDADSIKHLIDCINISCGYYNAHTRTEFTVLDELIETSKAVSKFLDRDWSSMPWDAIKAQHKFRFKPETSNKQHLSDDTDTMTYEEWVAYVDELNKGK